MAIKAGRTHKAQGHGFTDGTLIQILGTEDGRVFDVIVLAPDRSDLANLGAFHQPRLGQARLGQIGAQVPTPHQLISV